MKAAHCGEDCWTAETVPTRKIFLAGCYARAASGHAAAAPPMSVMNSRRFISRSLSWQLAQQLLRNTYDVVFTVG